MGLAAKELKFEKAARLRDQIKSLENLNMRGDLKQHAQPEVFQVDPRRGLLGLKKIFELPSLLSALTGFSPFGMGMSEEPTGPAKPKTGRKLTGRKPKASGDGSTTGGGVDLPTADPAAGTLEKPEEKKTESKPEDKTEDKSDDKKPE